MRSELLSKLNRYGWEGKWNLYKDVFEYEEYFSKIESPSISVIVISWRLHKDTIKSFRILEKQRKQNFELIFVDNGAKDGEFDCLKPYIDTYIKLNKNTGAYLARNIGALFAKAPILFFLEDDGIPDVDLLESHKEIFNCYDVIAVRGVYLYKTNNPLNGRQLHYYLGNRLSPSYCNLEGNASYCSKTFYKVGGWDDEIVFGGGGIELAIRLLNEDNNMTKQVYSPASIIYHDYVLDEKHLESKIKKQQESFKRLKSKYPCWDEYMHKWQSLYGKSHLIKKKKIDVHDYEEVLERVVNRNVDKINQIKSGIVSRYDIKEMDKLKEKTRGNFQYIIFGASNYGRQILKSLKKHNITIDYFTDNDKNKWGRELEGVEIIKPDKLKDGCFIFIASNWFYEIVEQLERQGFKQNVNYVVIK